MKKRESIFHSQSQRTRARLRHGPRTRGGDRWAQIGGVTIQSICFETFQRPINKKNAFDPGKQRAGIVTRLGRGQGRAHRFLSGTVRRQDGSIRLGSGDREVGTQPVQGVAHWVTLLNRLPLKTRHPLCQFSPSFAALPAAAARRYRLGRRRQQQERGLRRAPWRPL